MCARLASTLNNVKDEGDPHRWMKTKITTGQKEDTQVDGLFEFDAAVPAWAYIHHARSDGSPMAMGANVRALIRIPLACGISTCLKSSQKGKTSIQDDQRGVRTHRTAPTVSPRTHPGRTQDAPRTHRTAPARTLHLPIFSNSVLYLVTACYIY